MFLALNGAWYVVCYSSRSGRIFPFDVDVS